MSQAVVSGKHIIDRQFLIAHHMAWTQHLNADSVVMTVDGFEIMAETLKQLFFFGSIFAKMSQTETLKLLFAAVFFLP